MPSNVRVAVRVRPMLDNEVKQGLSSGMLDVDSSGNKITVKSQKNEGQSKTYSFDKIIDEKLCQEAVFDQL